jgi:hypothetical protein
MSILRSLQVMMMVALTAGILSAAQLPGTARTTVKNTKLKNLALAAEVTSTDGSATGEILSCGSVGGKLRLLDPWTGKIVEHETKPNQIVKVAE